MSCMDSYRGRATTHHWWMGVLVLFIILARPALADNPNQPQGFGPERTFQRSPALPDQVDLFSGRLSVTLPIGPYTLVYNNNVWRYSEVVENNQIKIQALPDSLQNAGLGWHLGWGELYPPDHPYNDSPAELWLYVGADGTRHMFYDALHRGEDDGDLDVFYTRDNSFLRLRKIGSTSWDIEFPDGQTRRFAKGGPGLPYRLVKGWDRFGSASDPDFTIAYSADDKLRTMTDRYGRHHYVHLAGDQDLVDGYLLSWMSRVITQVDLQGVDGQRSVYNFSYRNILVNVSCKNTSSQIGPRIRLPHLVRIDQPGGTAYVMQEGSTPSYINTCPAGIDDAPGSLTRMALPTGGVMRWTFQQYEFPPGHNWGPFNTSTGVATREAVNADGTVLGSWNYKTRDFGGTPTTDPEMWTDVVVLPEGDCTRHYFSAIDYVLPSQGKGWEYGLPFVRSVEESGRFLSTEVYTGHNASSMLCSGTRLRSTYLHYRHDPTPGVATQPNDPACQSTSPCSRVDEWYSTNRTLDASRTVFHDDGNRWTDTQMSEYDGIGNFRRSVSTGNLWSGSAYDEEREVYVDFTRSPGTFPGGGYSHPGTSEPWILRVYDRVDTTEPDATGETTSRVEFVFDDTTGALQCTRTIRTGTNRTLQDVVMTLDRDSRGNVTDVKTYGANRTPLPSTSGADCGTLTANPAYWTHHEYDYDELSRSRPYHPNGTPGAFLTHDVTIDPSSGVPLASRDSAGFETTYTYDAAGRMVTITPEEGATATFTYTNPSGTTPAGTHVSLVSGATVFREEERNLDSFGREFQVRLRMKDNTWAERQVRRNARGWVSQRTEWNAPILFTQYLEYDPFGRPGRIRPPEGSHHDVVLEYEGIRKTTRSAPVQTTLDGAEVYVTHTRESDRYGRLRTVVEPAGTGGSDVTTSYLYDVGGHMTRSTSGQGSLQQLRLFQVDNRGFLLSETLPEKGPNGNGTVYYSDHDASGRYYRMLDHNHDLGLSYDFVGRPTLAQDRLQGNRTLRSFTYDSAPGLGLGKVYEAKAYNYLKVPANNEPFQVDVTQRFEYQGVGGSINRKETLYTTPSGAFTLETNFGYDDGGNVTSIDYPRCVSANCAASSLGSSPNLTFNYTRGWLKSIPGWVNRIDYHPGGLWSRIIHSNFVSDYQDVDAYHKGRPGRIYMTGASPYNWDSGSMTYDGSGNIARIGEVKHAYDRVNRLMDYEAWDGGELIVSQQYTYDIFGNLLTRTGQTFDPALTTFPVDSQTNRLLYATYDGAGNILTANGNYFAYDPFNRLINQAWMAYAYDAFGERAASFAASSTASAFHLRGLHQELLSTLYFDGDSTYIRMKDYVTANGRPIGVLDNNVKVHAHGDHLGTQQLVTNAYGSNDAYPYLLPYGRALDYGTRDNRLFTGHERDFSTDSDYMHTRHYWSDIARFLSVDSFRGSPTMPQSLNRYAYAMGNPVNRIDPDGRWAFFYHWYIDILTSAANENIDVVAPSVPFSRWRGGEGGGGSTEGGGAIGGGDPTLDPPEIPDPEPPEEPEIPVVTSYVSVLLENAEENASKPPCVYISAPHFDPWRYSGTRILDQTKQTGLFLPLPGALRPFAFFNGTSREFWIEASKLVGTIRRGANAGATVGQALNGGSDGVSSPDWCSP